MGKDFAYQAWESGLSKIEISFPIVRNLDLIPEESSSYEVGLRSLFPLSGSSNTILFDVALFWNEFEHLIETAFVTSKSAFQFVNLTSARIRGMEASLESRLLNESLHLRVGYTYLDAEDLETNSSVVVQIEAPTNLVYRRYHLKKHYNRGRFSVYNTSGKC